MATAVDATNFQNYKSGIFDNCGVQNVNLAVLLVGISDSYYKVKVAWGTQWGELGFIRLRYTPNICGICFFPTDVRV